MSQYLGRNKNKSRSRYIARKYEENREKEGMKEVFDIMKDIKTSKEEPVCYVCGRPAYKSDSENYICESLAYKGHCKPLETESVESRIINKNN